MESIWIHFEVKITYKWNKELTETRLHEWSIMNDSKLNEDYAFNTITKGTTYKWYNFIAYLTQFPSNLSLF